ncbi:uncharacterized protein [Atheta coriaria]|uniref:uncharacterized protein isoform X2 n=1 Tax=Dalotia coriaria TaxID=877792 RepID=UPI0031F3AD4E
MAIELRLIKDDSATSWGFRLVGGANFEIPLSTIKVVENSIAEECGLQVGDVIVKINDDDITALTHAQAHDRIIQAGNELTFTIIRCEISDVLRSLINDEQEEIEDVNHEVESLLEGSVPIDYPEKTIEDLIRDTTEAECALPKHDLNLTDEDIHNIINPEIVTRKEKCEIKPIGPPAKGKLEAPQVLQPEVQENIVAKAEITTENVKFMQSQVIQEINNNLRDGNTDGEKRWSTFLQKPQRAAPLLKPQFQVQKSTYRVKIRTKKDLEAERIAKQLELEAEALRQQKLAEQEALGEQGIKKEENESSDDEISSDSSFTFSDSDNITESTITFTPSGTEPTISFTESLNSLEEKLEQVKEQLQIYNVELVPDALQKMLTKIASQLEKIVKVVKPQAQNLPVQNGDATDDDNYDDFSDDDDESSIASFDSRISSPTPSTPSYQGTEPTLTFTSYSIMSDPPSPSTPEGTEPSLTFSDGHDDVAECDRTEYDVTEMQEYQEDVKIDDQNVTKEEKTNKKEKVEHWNRIWPWTHVTQPIYRESNCCMVPSKMTDTKKINFLKYQPPPKNLDHLKNSEVYKMVHNMGPDTDTGIFTRPEKVISGQDYHTNTNSGSPIQF